jgi:hypothetical protein
LAGATRLLYNERRARDDSTGTTLRRDMAVEELMSTVPALDAQLFLARPAVVTDADPA